MTAVLICSLPGFAEEESQVLLRQHHDTSCGYAVTASLLNCCYGQEVSEASLIEAHPPETEDGRYVISFLCISEMLCSQGVVSQGFFMALEDLPRTLEQFGPIICWDEDQQGHFYVLLHIFQDRFSNIYVTGDPSSGIIYEDTTAFRSRWSGRAVISEGGRLDPDQQERLEAQHLAFSRLHHRFIRSGAPR